MEDMIQQVQQIAGSADWQNAGGAFLKTVIVNDEPQQSVWAIKFRNGEKLTAYVIREHFDLDGKQVRKPFDEWVPSDSVEIIREHFDLSQSEWEKLRPCDRLVMAGEFFGWTTFTQDLAGVMTFEMAAEEIERTLHLADSFATTFSNPVVELSDDLGVSAIEASDGYILIKSPDPFNPQNIAVGLDEIDRMIEALQFAKMYVLNMPEPEDTEPEVEDGIWVGN